MMNSGSVNQREGKVFKGLINITNPFPFIVY